MPSIVIRETELFTRELRTRIPFRYGIATMTRVPHLILRAVVEIDGRVQHGFSADHLPPKWFTKDPDTSMADDLADMLAVIRHACRSAKELGSVATVFALRQQIYAAQRRWADAEKFPPLLSGFGVSLVERACIDAFCRATGTTFAQALRANAFGIRLGDIHPELGDAAPAAFLPPEPLRRIRVRHTVGLGDPLTEADIASEDRVEDGLPQSLEESIRRYGLTHFKIKLSGNIERDGTRLRQLAQMFGDRLPSIAFTLDGNENFHTLAPFRALWEQLLCDGKIAAFLRQLVAVEQPLHRDVALTEETAAELNAWPERPPLIIDESDAEPASLRTALAAGYIGTSFKNCKGVFRGVANACLIAQRRAANPGLALQITAEDLTNIGPVALLQDLAVVASLGIQHAERNGQHYFAGLSQFPPGIQNETFTRHPDLYEMHPAGSPTLRISGGTLCLDSIVDAPFGTAFKLPSEHGFDGVS